MPTVVYLHGHGGWAPSMGFTQVPKKCSISFYTHFAKLLNATMVQKIFAGTYLGDFDRTIEAFGTVPNLRMDSLTTAQRQWAINSTAGSGKTLVMLPAAPPNRSRTLAQLMEWSVENIGPELDFRWLCCQSLSLKQQGGRKLGLNASDRTAQDGHEGQYLFKWVENGVEQTRWVNSNSSIHH